MFYASIFSNGSGAFRGTGALRFFFIPKGALTHHPRCGWWYGLRPTRALRGGCGSVSGPRAAFGGWPPTRTPAGECAGAYSQCCRDCGPGHHCLRGGNGAPFPPPAKTCHRQLYRSAESDRFARPCFLFAAKRNRKKIGGENDWLFIIWRRRSSAEGQAVPHARPRLT